MKKTLASVLAAVAIAVTLAATATDASAQWGRGWGPGWGWRGGCCWGGPGVGAGIAAGVVGGAIVAGAILATRPAGYVVYPGYAQPLSGPGCYWASQPILDPYGRVVGYTGQPVQVCPDYAPPPPPPAYAGQRDAAAPPNRYPPGAPASAVRSTTQTAIGRYNEYCGHDSRDIAGVPVDEIRQTVNATDEQRAALDELGNASVQAAQIIKASCPTDVSLTPIGRIDAMQQRVQAMLNAVKVVRPALEKLYNMLTDEQKARFNAFTQHQRPPENEGATVSGGSPVAGCRNRAIPDWSTAQIQRSVHPTPAQQTALNTLQDAAAKARDIQEASCPSEMPATPLARLSAIEQRLQTILAAIETVRGPLNTFYSSLSDEQKAQFNMIGRTRATKQG